MRAGVFLTLAAVLAAVASGCGSSGALSLDPVAAAATKTSGQGGTYTISAEFTGMGKDSGAFTGTGVFDADGNMTLDMKIADAEMHVIAVTRNSDVIMYISSPLFAKDLPQGKSWLEFDLTKAMQRAGVDATKALQGFQSPGSDPTQVLGMLGRASNGVTKVGDGTILNGVHATHYHADLDLAKAAEEAGVPGVQAQQLEHALASTKMPVDVWVDDDGFVREMDEHMSMTMKGKTATATITFTVPEVGPQQPIAAPPNGDAFDVTDDLPH